MRELLYTLAVLAVSLLLIAAVVFGLGDRSTLVPVPEAVAENFAHHVAGRRFELAVQQLAAQTKRAETPQTLAVRFEPLLAMTGKINRVDAELQWTQEVYASARATIEGDAGSASFAARMVRENGLWRVEQLSDLVR